MPCRLSMRKTGSLPGAVSAASAGSNQPVTCRVTRSGSAGHERFRPRARGDDRGAGLYGACVGLDGHRTVARLDRTHDLAGADLRACGNRQRRESFDRGLDLDKSAVRLHHADIVRRQPEGREALHQFARRQHLMAERMMLGGGERAAHQDAVGRADLRDAGDMEQRPSGCGFQVPPQRVGAAHQRHVGGVLEVAEPDDAGQAVRRPAVVARNVAVEPQDPHAAAGELIERSASHGAKAADDDIEMSHEAVQFLRTRVLAARAAALAAASRPRRNIRSDRGVVHWIAANSSGAVRPAATAALAATRAAIKPQFLRKSVR